MVVVPLLWDVVPGDAFSRMYSAHSSGTPASQMDLVRAVAIGRRRSAMSRIAVFRFDVLAARRNGPKHRRDAKLSADNVMLGRSQPVDDAD
jgi:hypothetical protein